MWTSQWNVSGRDITQYSYADEPLSCLPWLLAQASKLEVLVAPAGKTPWLPSLATLKHLCLCIHNDPGNFCVAVLRCTFLETLSVVCQEETFTECLEMKDLPSLRVAVLKGINPESISVPMGCQLHIDISNKSDMQRTGMWQRALVNIHGFDITMPHPDLAALEFFQNMTLKPLQNIQVLHIQLSGGNSVYDVFDLTGFARIKKLSTSGEDLALRIPAGVSWDTLEVVAKEGLLLIFEDVSGFTQAVHCFSACYSRLCGTGALELCAAQLLRGIKCAFQDKGSGRWSKLWFPADASPFGCCCGACLECLIASGALVADAGEAQVPGRPRLREYIDRLCS